MIKYIFSAHYLEFLTDSILVYRYKFIVDGEWVTDADQPTIVNNVGSYDNYIKVTFVTMCRS